MQERGTWILCVVCWMLFSCSWLSWPRCRQTTAVTLWNTLHTCTRYVRQHVVDWSSRVKHAVQSHCVPATVICATSSWLSVCSIIILSATTLYWVTIRRMGNMVIWRADRRLPKLSPVSAASCLSFVTAHASPWPNCYGISSKNEPAAETAHCLAIRCFCIVE